MNRSECISEAVALPLVAQQQVSLAIPWPLLVAGVVILGIMLAAGIRLLRRPQRTAAARDEPRAIDVAALAGGGPLSGAARLQVYGTPVRLAVVVLAAVGRSGRLPPDHALPELLDNVVPGLKRVLLTHKPLVVRWPEQLSSQGFTQAFFSKVALPGDRGKGTPWCSLAGKFDVEGRQFLVGLTCCSAASNGLAQIVIEHEGQWLDIVRARETA